MALEFLLFPPPFCFAKSVFHSHIPEIWRGSAVCYFLCVYMAPLIVGFLKKVNNLQEGWSSIFPSWKMLSAGRAKNKGRILRQDLPLYTIFLFIFFFLYTLSFCSFFSVPFLSVPIFQLELAGLLSDMVSDGTFRYSASFYFIIYTWT